MTLKTKCKSVSLCSLVALILAQAGCDRSHNAISIQSHREPPATAPAAAGQNLVDPLRIILAPLDGDRPLDAKILAAQSRVRAAADPIPPLEQLGWLFVARARESFDAGYYDLAEQCALCMEARRPCCPEALLLRGHALQNMHRFKDAEPLARELAQVRGLPFDFGLLGDVLMEQGHLREAIVAYQKMVDLRPDLHSYARGAHIRWLRGNLKGALELTLMATSAASPRDAESAAWVHTRLAAYQLQAGKLAEADDACATALDFQKDYPPALLMRGRIFLARNDFTAAAQALRRAAELNPLPEYLWAEAEALRGVGRADEAAALEAQIRKKGPALDPRTCSLFLATRGEDLDLCLRLVRAELNVRRDVFTHDALAWALAQHGLIDEARQQMALAVSEGTRDGRLFFHAAMIANRTGHHEEAQRWAQQAMDLNQMLLPSERDQLASVDTSLSALQKNSPLAQAVAAAGGNSTKKGNIE